MIIRRVVDDVDYEFVCSSVGNRSGFKHKCDLYVGKYPYIMCSSSVQYYNRTWECWQYQTVCRNTVDKLISERIDKLTCEYKDSNKISRITKKHRVLLDDIIDKDGTISQYRKVREALK